MKFVSRFLVVAVSLLFKYYVSSEAESVSIDPTAFTAGVDTVEVNFTCRATAPPTTTVSVILLINGTFPSAELRESRGLQVNPINNTEIRLMIQPSVVNNGTNVSCVALFGRDFMPKSTRTVTLHVQGLLDSPSDLEFDAAPPPSTLRRLSWKPPFTLDITNADPDITYSICFNLFGSPVCNKTLDIFYDFISITFPSQFTVTPSNVVGEGVGSSAMYLGCVQDVPGTNSRDNVQVRVAAAPQYENNSVRVGIQELPEVTCYNVYSFEVTETTWSTPLQFGPFVPVLDSLRVLQLKEINLSTNSIFTLKLKAIHADGELPFNGTITFSTYDVQAVNLFPEAGGLRVSCFFLEGSVAQGCQLTLCRVQERTGSRIQCRDITIEQFVSTKVVEVVAAKYVITEVADIEEDGNTTAIDTLSILGNLEVTITPDQVSTNPPPSTGDIGALSTVAAPASAGAIVAAVMGVLVVIAMGITIAIFIVYLLYRRRSGSISVDSDGSWSGQKANRIMQGQKEGGSWTDSITKETDDSTLVMATKVDVTNPAPVTQAPHRATSPFYTDVMQTSTPSSPQETNPPLIPPKRAAKHHSDTFSEHSSIIPTPDFRVPLQNLSQEEPSHRKSNHEWLGSRKGNTQMSQESLISQGSQLSVSAANLTYAEIEHHHKAKKKATPRDKNTVLYSEIRVEEIPPVLPQKKSLKGRRTASNASSVDLDCTQSGLGFRV